MGSDLHWYEREAFERWAAERGTSPLTREVLQRGVPLNKLSGCAGVLAPNGRILVNAPTFGLFGVPRRHVRAYLRTQAHNTPAGAPTR